MDIDEAAKSLLSNTGLLAATVTVIVAIRAGVPKRSRVRIAIRFIWKILVYVEAPL